MNSVLTRSGEVSAEALANGYVLRETKLTKEYNARLMAKELYFDGKLYHVRKFTDSQRQMWRVFDTINMARKAYKEIKL